MFNDDDFEGFPTIKLGSGPLPLFAPVPSSITQLGCEESCHWLGPS